MHSLSIQRRSSTIALRRTGKRTCPSSLCLRNCWQSLRLIFCLQHSPNVSNAQENADRLTRHLHAIAKKYNLAFEAFNKNVTDTIADSESKKPSAGTMRLSDPRGIWLDPSPVSPTDSAAYALLAGSIRQTWGAGLGARVGGKGSNETMIVAPGMVTGTSPCVLLQRAVSSICLHIDITGNTGECLPERSVTCPHWSLSYSS